MTNLDDYFTHGSQYPGDVIDKPREVCCRSCAFTNSKETVRPNDVSIIDLQNFASDLDVFYCHTQEPDGSYKICAKWYALVEGDLLQLKRSEAEIDAILNKDME